MATMTCAGRLNCWIAGQNLAIVHRIDDGTGEIPSEDTGSIGEDDVVVGSDIEVDSNTTDVAQGGDVLIGTDTNTSNEGSSDGCSAGTSSKGAWSVVIIMALAIVVLRRRRENV